MPALLPDKQTSVSGLAQLLEPRRITEQQWPESTMPMVSICCLAYNQEKLIEQCIEGFLEQETTFPVEIIIHDDASTDRTAEIIRDYQAKYPQLIRSILQKENQFSQGRKISSITFAAVRGKYIALCDGDDYWITPLKLEKQVRILEQEPQLSMVFHNAWVRHDDSRMDYFMNQNLDKERFTLDDIVSRDWFIATASMVFRSERFEFPECLQFSKGGDMVIQMTSALNGDISYLNEICSVYRRHSGGISDPFWNDKSFYFEKLLPNHIWTYWVFDQQVSGGRGRASLLAWIKVLLKRIVDYRLNNQLQDPASNKTRLLEFVIDVLARAKPSRQLTNLENNSAFAALIESVITESLGSYYMNRARALARSGRILSSGSVLIRALIKKNLSLAQVMIRARKFCGF